MADDNPVDDSSILGRLAGYAWDEIKSFVDSPQQEAVDNGYTPEEIANERGQTPPARAQDAMSAYWQGRVASDDKLISGLQSAPPTPLTPLDAMSADRIAGHAGTTAPPVQAPSEDFIEPPPAIDFNDSDMRGHYADALLSGHVSGPRDFAEKYAGAFLGTPGVPTDDASQAAVVRAAGSLADTLPTNEDLTDSAIAIAHGAGVELTGDNVKVVKNNLVDNWRLTGQPMAATIQQANSDPDFASKITQPPTPPQPPMTPNDALDVRGLLGGEEGAPSPDVGKAVGDAIMQHFTGIIDDWSNWAQHQEEIANRLEGKPFSEKVRDPESMETAFNAAFGAIPANLEGRVADVIRDLPMPKVTVVDPSLEGAAAVKQVPASEAFAPEEAPSSQVARDLAVKIDRLHDLSIENAMPEGGGTFFQRKLQEIQAREPQSQFTFPTPQDPLALSQKGELNSDRATQIADELKDHFTSAENTIFGDEADQWRKLNRQSNAAWNNANDARAREIDAQIATIESKASPKDMDHLSGVGAKGIVDPDEWRDLARDLRDVEGDRDTAVSAVASQLRRLKLGDQGPIIEGERSPVAVISHAMSEETKRGGDPFQLLKEGFAESGARYGGGPDAEELVRSGMSRVSTLMNAAPEGGGTFFQRKLQEMVDRGEITPSEAEKAPQLSNDQLAENAKDHAAGNGIRGFLTTLMGDESGAFKPGPYRTPAEQQARDAYVASRDYQRTEIVRNEHLANQEFAHWTDYLEPSHPAVNAGMKEWTRELDKGAAGNPMGTSIGQMMDYIEGRSNGVVMAPGSKLAPVADSIRDVEQAMDKRMRQQAQDGIITYDGYIEDHFRHQWTDGTAAANAFKGTGKLGESGGLRERTTFPTISDGLRAGQALKYPNPLEAELHDASGKILYSYAADMIDKAEKDGFLYRAFSPKNDGDVRVNGRIGERAIPMQKPVALRQAEAAARDALAAAQARGVNDLQPYIDAVRDATEAAKPSAQIQNLYGNPGAVTAINDWLSAGLYARPSTASLYDKALYAKNISTAYKLIMPIFHAKVVALGSLASGLGQAMEETGRGQLASAMLSLGKVATVVPNIAENMIVGRRAMQSYVKMSGDPIVQYLTEAGLNFGPRQRIYQMGSAPPIWTSIKRGSLGQELVTSFKSMLGDPKTETDMQRIVRFVTRARPLQTGAHEVGRLMTTATAPLFDHVVPMIKIGASYSRLQSFIKANPTASPDVILAKAKQIAGDVDNRLGELNMNTVFWPKTAKQIANMTALSQGWVYGTYRGALGAMGIDIERGALKWNPTSASSAAGAVIAYGYVNALMTWLNTGQAPWQSETPIRDLMNYRTGGVDTKGNVERGMFPAELKEWFDISKIVAVGMAGYQKAGAVGIGNALPAVTNYMLGKINPFLAFLHTAMTGEDAIGNKFWTPSGFDKIMKETFDPIVLDQIAKEKKGSNIGFWSSLMGERVAPPQAENWQGFVDQMKKVFDRNEKQQSARNARENAQLVNPDPTIPPPNVRGGGGRSTARQREINAAASSDFGARATAEAALERTRQARASRPAAGGPTGNYRQDAWEKVLPDILRGQRPATDHTGRQQRYSRQAVYQRAVRGFYARQRAVHGIVGGQEAIGGGAQGV